MAAIAYDELFNRLGRIGHIAYLIDGGQAGVPAALIDLFDNYESTTDLDLIGTLITQQFQLPSQITSVMNTIAGLAQSTIFRMVQASQPSVRSVPGAVLELIRQMTADAQAVATCTIGVSNAALTTNIGNGVVVTSTKRGDGLVQQNTVAEVLRLACTADSYTGGCTAGQERFGMGGQPNTASLWDYNWPTGSGSSSNATAVSADIDANTSSNLLTNGDFETWAGSPVAASNFVLSTGTWGTDITRSATANRGTYSLDFIAGTGVNTALYQQFNTGTTGTVANPSSLNSYAVNFWGKRVGVVSAGVLTVELVDGSGTVINDQQGVANSTTFTLSAWTTSFVAKNVVFRIPDVPPSTMRLRFRISTALTGADVLIDDLCFSPLVSAYSGGFGYQVFSGATPFVTQDAFNVTATNDRAGVLYGANFQTLFQRFYGMMNLNPPAGLLLPYSTGGGITQPTSKITA